jgi:broad specificity phosphatase PhoE
MKNKSLSLLVILILIISACHSEQKPIQYIYLVRHAEKDLSDTTNNPPLTPEGEARAEKLMKEMESLQLDQIFSTTYDRNWQTVEPTAEAHEISITPYSRYNWQGMVDSVLNQSKKNTLICGHGDNLYQLITAFGAPKPTEKLGKHEYDNLYEIRVYEDSVALVLKKF